MINTKNFNKYWAIVTVWLQHNIEKPEENLEGSLSELKKGMDLGVV